MQYEYCNYVYETLYTIVHLNNNDNIWGWGHILHTFYMQEWDKDESGSISVEQMREIFRIYKVGVVKISDVFYCRLS